MIGIYSITNTKNNKHYIGQSKDIKRRFVDHKSALKNNRHYNEHLQRAWNEYGESCFIFEILKECSLEDLDSEERFYIVKYNSMNPSYGYNRESGGSKYKEMSLESKQKLSQSIMGHSVSKETVEKLRTSHLGKHLSEEAKQKMSKYFKGRRLTEEHKAKISEANKGRKVSEETRKKLSEAHKGIKWTEEHRQKVVGKYTGKNNPNYGKKLLPETIEKIRLSHIGKKPWNKGIKNPKNYKPVKDLTNNIVYQSLQEAEKITGIRHIGECANGHRKRAGGIAWAYI